MTVFADDDGEDGSPRAQFKQSRAFANLGVRAA